MRITKKNKMPEILNKNKELSQYENRAILETASANEDQPRDYSTTLLLAICKKFDFGCLLLLFGLVMGLCAFTTRNANILNYWELLTEANMQVRHAS